MLTERQLLILKAIVQLFTKYEQPIGSKKLLDETQMSYSSATVRNEMSQLENKGYLQKTHTSSGRIPSLKGYRLYIDHLLELQHLASEDQNKMQLDLGAEFKQMDDVIRHSADVLSQLTNYTAIVLGPEHHSHRLTGFRIVQLNKRQMMAILVTDNGSVENMTFQLPQSVKPEDLEKLIRIINEELVGDTLLEVYEKLKHEIPILIQKYARSAEGIMTLFSNSFLPSKKDTVHISGKMNFLNYTDTIEASKIKSIYESMNHKSELITLLTEMNRGIDVRIGEELKNELFSEFSLVTGSFIVKDHGKGIVAVLGPTNMSYEKTIGQLNSFRHELSNALLKFYLSE